MNSKEAVINLLQEANIKINGNNPWDIEVTDERFFSRVLSDGSLGLGESYMDEWWNCKNLDTFIYKLLRGNLEEKYNHEIVMTAAKEKIKSFFNHQSIAECKKDISFHYDTGNVLFKNMLDSRMVYSCGYWANAKNIDEAQENKLDLICKKIGLKPGMKVLDVGCGWGPFMKYAVENYGVECVGITLSKEQIKLGEEMCKGLPIQFLYSDYRELSGMKFDRVVSIGMFEHVGPKNYEIYMKKISEFLDDNGIFLLHTIGGLKTKDDCDKWIRKYIFPNGTIPSIKQIGEAAEDYFYMEDWHDFGPDYDKTLMVWHDNFQKNWDIIKPYYNNEFKRIWEYYLLSCAGAFRARELALWQVVFTKKRQEKPICRF